jgi:hypothetical protein
MKALTLNAATTSERLNKVAEILATGLQRLHARQSSALPADFRDSLLDCAADQSGHANALNDGGGVGG